MRDRNGAALHQRSQAEAAGYVLDEVVVDHGISGVRTALRERPEGRRLFDMLRQGDTLVVRWVDRLGRNYADVTDTIRQFIRRGVIVRTVINGLTFDGATREPHATGCPGLPDCVHGGDGTVAS